MFRIANEYGIQLNQLIAANPQVTNPNIISPGQELCIPIEITPTPPPTEFCPNGTIYIAQQGDTLFLISRRYGITVQKLIEANPQIPDPNILEVGQRVCIPIPDLPIPNGACKAELMPIYRGVLGGTAFVDVGTPTLWIATFGLPAPAIVNPQFSVYVAWVYNPTAGSYVKTRLIPTDAPGIEVGYKAFEELITFEGFTEIIVTAEPAAIPNAPSGTVFLKGKIVC
ncbi:LysM peptidoglycan-binding domain-containing protein [Alkaliphilus serpentinus]|uniref:LysM peptidoglycan-binding domain-containing protein n=2 Tax=Alkaliphilus serpentinus TaxID=1482731 RepID=A0A833M8A8_9FIRM|nr:LysM peptidoglycan-binding domain-containing protein [Alkaliphilus serpentinus]